MSASRPSLTARAAEAGRRTVAVEAAGLGALGLAFGEPAFRDAFEAAVERLRAARGRVIVSGMGKSGHVGRKIAATLASTGTPAHFVHPAEASHGDLGMVGPEDVILALSWSGETAELAPLIAYSRRHGVPLLAVTANGDSALGRAADVALLLPKAEEACPHGLAPTTSTTMQLALGDALAVALLEARGFTAGDFRRFHPGGKLGAQLALVDDLMHAGAEMPLVASGTRMADALITMSEKRFGCCGVLDGERLAGIVTDGDLRRHMGPDLLDRPIETVMTRTPRTVRAGSLAAAALESMNRAPPVTVLFVVEGEAPVGVLHVHDLLRAGVA